MTQLLKNELSSTQALPNCELSDGHNGEYDCKREKGQIQSALEINFLSKSVGIVTVVTYTGGK